MSQGCLSDRGVNMRHVLLLIGVVAGCDSLPTTPESVAWTWEHPFLGAPCDLSAPGPSLEPYRGDSIPVRQGHETVDDRWAAIARQAPGGWGGVFYVDGRLTIYLVRPEEAEDAIPVLNSLGARVGLQPDVLRGRWDFAQMYDWNRYIAHRGLWMVDGVYGSSIDEKMNRLHYRVTPESLPSLAQFLTDLRVPCGLVIADVAPNNISLDGGT